MKKISILRLESGRTITHEPQDETVCLEVQDSPDGVIIPLRFTREQFRDFIDWLQDIGLAAAGGVQRNAELYHPRPARTYTQRD